MTESKSLPPKDSQALYERNRDLWTELRGIYLTINTGHSIWLQSREMQSDDPEQGWKLHVSATVLNACRVLKTVGPLLRSRGVLYKAPMSLDELAKLNAGIYYGYSQVGKFLTIYPPNTSEALLLAGQLHTLTQGLRGPAVPFDLKYRPNGCVYYRYGAFKTFSRNDEEGEAAPRIRDPLGNLGYDDRESPAAKPEWVSNPFPVMRILHKRELHNSPLKTTFKAFRALAQRGKGGVYQAVDQSVTPPRLCILKEGRRHGEVDWDGRDGLWRVKYEARVLRGLRDRGLSVPVVYSSFQAEKNHYLATEFIEGEDLETWLCRKKRRLSVRSAVKLGVKIALLVSRIHMAGWVWRDCKPRNIIRTKRGELRPIDFEGACPIDRPDSGPFGTQTFVPPEVHAEFHGQSRLPEDLYALGATLYIVIVGRPPDAASLPIMKKRRNIPEEVCRVITQLLHADPRRRPAASQVARRLNGVLENLTPRSHGERFIRRAKFVKTALARKPSYTESVVR